MTRVETRFKDWQMDNPIRSYRTGRGVSRNSVAAICNVSPTSVEKWETGTSTPGDESMAAIASMLGIGVTTLRSRWAAWESDRPQS